MIFKDLNRLLTRMGTATWGKIHAHVCKLSQLP